MIILDDDQIYLQGPCSEVFSEIVQQKHNVGHKNVEKKNSTTFPSENLS